MATSTSVDQAEAGVDPVAEFLAKGGKIQQIPEGVTAGDYTDQRMREAENEAMVHNPYYR